MAFAEMGMNMEPRTILLIVADCLRPDHLSCYGYNRKTSRYIDELADEGVVFTRAYSQSTWTRPTAASLLTGLYPGVHGVQIDGDALSDNIVTLPKTLRSRGFHSALFSAVGQVSHYTNLHKDFDEDFPLYWSKECPIRMTRADEVVKVFCQWFDQHLNEKTFSLLWFVDTHYPYYVPDKSVKFSQSSVDFTGTQSDPYKQDQEFLNRRMDGYDDSINHVDNSIGNLIQFLKARNKFDDSMIFILADHGEMFNEYGKFDFVPLLKRFQGERHSEAGHGHVFPYEELIRVPMVVKFPEQQYTGKCSRPVQLIDIPTTISECFDANLHTQGTNLTKILESNGTNYQRQILAEYWGRNRNLRCSVLLDSSFKYVRYSHTRSMKNLMKSALCFQKRHNVFREIAKELVLSIIPDEYLLSIEDEPLQRNLVSSEQSLHKNMLESLDGILEDNQELRTELGTIGKRLEGDTELEEHLRSLGYLD